VIQAVIETNVLVSAMISLSGNEVLLLTRRQARLCQDVSDEILEEYSGVLTRRRFGFAKGEISSGAVEGLNNKIRVVTRRSYGSAPIERWNSPSIARLADFRSQHGPTDFA
jgi:predicted nucleic acid-binding protein